MLHREPPSSSAVQLDASTSDGCPAPRRNCVSPSRAGEVKDGRSPSLAARAKRRVLDVDEHDGSAGTLRGLEWCGGLREWPSSLPRGNVGSFIGCDHAITIDR